MRNRIRYLYLALARDWVDYWSHCWYCGRRGASVCSLVYPRRLCNSCATRVCRNSFELDAFAKEIPDLVFHGTTAYGLLTHTIQRKYPDDVKKKEKEN